MLFAQRFILMQFWVMFIFAAASAAAAAKQNIKKTELKATAKEDK